MDLRKIAYLNDHVVYLQEVDQKSKINACMLQENICSNTARLIVKIYHSKIIISIIKFLTLECFYHNKELMFSININCQNVYRCHILPFHTATVLKTCCVCKGREIIPSSNDSCIRISEGNLLLKLD